MNDLHPCPSCAELVAVGACVCPHCGGKACANRSITGVALLLGLTLATGCPESQAVYSAPATGTPTDSADTGTTTEQQVAKPDGD